MDMFVTFLLGFFITAISYMVFPLLCILLNNGRFESEMAKKISLWNSIIVGAIYLILTVVLTDSTWRATQAVIYYWANQAILTEKPKQRSGTMSNTKMATPTTQKPVTNPKPAPTQEDVIRELQKQVKMQELSRLSQMYNEKLCQFKRNSRIRWIITFCGFSLAYFGILLLVLGDVNIGATLLLAVIFTAIHFLINVSIFGWLIKKRIAEEKQLDPIIKKVDELEQSLTKQRW